MLSRTSHLQIRAFKFMLPNHYLIWNKLKYFLSLVVTKDQTTSEKNC